MNEINPEAIVEKLQNYLNLFSQFCSENTISTDGVNIDHIGYKCGNQEEYDKLRKYFESQSSFIYQSILSNRRSAYISLKKPLSSIFGDVYYLELADQKPDNSQKSSCDHIEPIPNKITYEEMLKRFSVNGLQVEENIKQHHSTHDVVFPNGVKIKMSHEPLVHTIYNEKFIAK